MMHKSENAQPASTTEFEPPLQQSTSHDAEEISPEEINRILTLWFNDLGFYDNNISHTPDAQTPTNDVLSSIDNNEKKPKRRIADFNDSSDDEDIVENNPYEGLTPIDPGNIKQETTLKRLKNIRTRNEILNHTPQTHQHLLTNTAIRVFDPVKVKTAVPHFVSPLIKVKEILDAVPSDPKNQLPDTIIPTFRGLKWAEHIIPSDLFYSTRARWKDEHHYSSKVFALSKIDINQHTKSVCINDTQLMEQHAHYDLGELDQNNLNNLTNNKEQLLLAANKLKRFFELADEIKQPFTYWKRIFPNLRNCKSLLNIPLLSFTEILSYHYVNNYQKFKSDFSTLDATLAKLDNKINGVIELKAFFKTMSLSKHELDEGIAFLSEGQIPRHALLYAFGLKCYTKDNELHPQKLYTTNLSPERGKAYLGKILTTKNPHTLFHGEDKATFVPHFDTQYGGGAIDKCIIGEKEIQHKGANLQGTIEKAINIKLPKFNHDVCPPRYLAKYGLDNNLYKEFKDTFLFLINKGNEHGRLSWMYLETLLLAHLLHFHEIQLFKYCNQMAAADNNKKISWLDRDEKPRTNPFPV